MTTPSPPSEAAHATVVRGSTVWLPPGAPAVAVGDYVISGGLVYLGSAVPAAYAATYEPAVIDPEAPVRRIRLDQETPAEGSRPAYGDLTPGARAAYLEWLTAGRTGPTQAAHLWLFLYGLERRILVDLAGTLGSQQEYVAIAAELAELAERYPHASTFVAKATEFTDLLDSLIGLNDPALRPPPAGPRTGELPMRLRVGIGRYVAHGLPVPPAWAYSWYAYSPYRCWGPEANRRPEDFQRAFAARYAEAHPAGGILVPPSGEDLVLEYCPANPGFADRTVRVHTQLPDVSGLTAPLEELADLAARAEADLVGAVQPAPYPMAGPSVITPAPTAEPTVTEPTVSEPGYPPPLSAPSAGWDNGTAGWDDGTYIAAPDLPHATAPDLPHAGPLDMRAARPMAPEYVTAAADTPMTGPTDQAYSTPADDAFAGPSQPPPAGPDAGPPQGPRIAGRAVLDARPEVAAAEALLRLVTLTGIAEGYVRAVRRHVVDALGLTVTERQGLDDRLEEFAFHRPTVVVVYQRFTSLPTEQQRAVTDLLIAAAGASGVLEPGQAAVLAAVFDLLGPGTGELQRRLGELEVAAVVDESSIDTTVLDEEVIEGALADALSTAALIDALVAPAARYAACT